MLVSEIHKAFKVAMDKNAEAISLGGCPAFLPAEIDLFLNQAYIEVINNKFTGNNTIKVPFEGQVKRINDLQKLVKTDKGISLSYLDSSSNVVTLSNFSNDSQRMFYVDCVLKFGDKKATCSLIDHATAKKFLQTYNNVPWIDTPIATIEDNSLKIYIDPISMTATSYTCDLTYVKYPTKIDNTQPSTDINEVPDSVIYEVIDRAVLIALDNIESTRTQVKAQLNTLAE